MSTRRIAILIDGGYFLHRLPKLLPPARCATPERVAGCLRHLCHNHVLSLTGCSRDRWQQINTDLFEHIDGLQSGLAKPGQRTGRQAATSQP